MQWTYMLIGLVLGWLLDESLSDAFVGALIGLIQQPTQHQANQHVRPLHGRYP